MKKPTPGCVLTIGIILCALTLQAIGADWNQYREKEARVKAIADNPEAIGDKELQFLISHLYYPESIMAIAKAKTPAAHAALWQIALEGGNGSHTAAYTLVERMTNKLECVKLLDSKNPKVQAIALRGLLGRDGMGPVILDRRTWKVTKDMLGSENLDHRRLATMVAAQSRGPEVTTEEKVKAVVASMSTTLTVPEARKRVSAGGFDWSYSCPLGEDVLTEQALALGRMKEASKELLVRLTPTEPGLVRQAMIIARFITGEQAVRGELHGILTNSASGRLRMAALEGGVSRTVTEAERACLEQIAAADPLQGMPGLEQTYLNSDVSLEGKRDMKLYPARILAGHALRALDARKLRSPGP